MKEKIGILVFSDVHFSMDTKIEEARWWPPAERILPEKIALKYLRRIDGQTQKCFYEMLKQASALASGLKLFDHIIELGDGTPGTNQRGIITQKAAKERLLYQRIISEFFPKTKRKSLWGNHDTGFYSKNTAILSLNSQIGYMDKKSYDSAKRLIGPPWQSFELGNFVFLLLNSEIIRASRSSVSPDRSFFKEQESKQEKFIENVLSNGSKKIILAIHDPSKLEFILPILENYQDRICLTLAGHYHTLSQEQIRRIFPWGERINFTKIIPNTWGGILEKHKLFNGKGGFAILELSDDSINIEYHHL
jgi:hypothetical protein